MFEPIPLRILLFGGYTPPDIPSRVFKDSLMIVDKRKATGGRKKGCSNHSKRGGQPTNCQT